MIDVVHVGTTPFLRNAFWVAMETMHFRIAQIRFFMIKCFVNWGVPMKDMAHM